MIPLLVSLSIFSSAAIPVSKSEPAHQVCIDMEAELQNSVDFNDIDKDTMNLILIRCYVNYS